LIVNYLRPFKNRTAIISGEQNITFNKLISKVNYYKKILKKKLSPGELVILDLPDTLEFIVIYLTCIELRLSFVPFNKYYTNHEKIFFKNLIKPSAIITFNKKINVKFFKKNFFIESSCIFFTSGTSSTPKGVCHSVETVIKNALNFNKNAKNNGGIFLQIFPMGYMAGFLNSIICPLLAGTTIVISQQIKNYNLINFWKIIKNYKINYLWLSPTIISYINQLEIEKKFYSVKKKLKKIFVGTSPFHSVTRTSFIKKTGIIPYESYGSTEMLLVSSNFSKNIYGSGRLLDKIQIKLNDDKELLIKSKYSFLGYYQKGGKIDKFRDNFFKTGDLALINKGIYLKITGRKKELIIKEGINISPKYLENKIMSHRCVTEVCVFGSKTNYEKEDIVAFVSLKNKFISVSDIKKYLEKKISKKFLPDSLIVLKNLPKNKSGKIDKLKLIKIYDNRNRSRNI